MRTRAVLLAVVLTMSTSGCWLQAGFGPGRTAYNDLETTITTANVNRLVHDWSAVLGSQSAAEPLVDGGATYVRSAGRLSSFDLATGAARWSVPAGSEDDVAGGSAAVPAMADGSLWVPTTGQACTLMQVDPANGATIGTRVYDGLLSRAVPPEALRFAHCRTGDALASGDWVVVPSTSVAIVDSSFVSGSTCSPGVDSVIWTARVSVIDVTVQGQGWVLSQESSGCTDSAPPAPPPFQPASTSLSGDQLLVAQASVVTAYPLVPCAFPQRCPPNRAWSLDVAGQVVGAPVALSNGDVAVGRADGLVVVIDGDSHAVQWVAPVGPRLSFPLAATPTSIYAVSNDDAATRTVVSALPTGGCGDGVCEPTWTATLASNPGGRASIGGDVLYIPHGQVLSALPAAGCGSQVCQSLWDGTVATSQPITGPPVIENGEVLVGYRNGELAAFSLPG